MREWFEKAHPFFWLICVAAVPSSLAAILATGREPAYALNSAWVYRLEVGLAFFLGLYVLGVVVWLAYQGRSVRGIQLPGGPGVDLPDPNLDAAAEGFEEFQRHADDRLSKHEDSLEELDERVSVLERRVTSGT